uniref:RING-type E3 ubiquitin transferase n=1 Tax=Poecilia mexicana TaxID=48701 RepID=A0A3B3YP08_9TELE
MMENKCSGILYAKHTIPQIINQFLNVVCSLTEMLVDLIKTVKRATMPRWIMVLPLLHLLRGTIKPFEGKTSGNRNYSFSWAGLEDIDINNQTYFYTECLSSHCMQTRSEGKLFERLKINWKFGNLISAIIQKSWPRDGQGKYQEKEEVVLQHLLSWTAAKDIFHLYDKKLIEKLSEDAKDRLAIAISAFTAIINQLIHGDIKISLLNKEQHRDLSKMKRFLQHRAEEVKAVYHEKELVDVILTMCHKLEEHMPAHHFDQLATTMSGIVTFFSLDEEIRDMATFLYTFNESIVLQMCWEKFAKEMARDEMEDADGEISDFSATPEMIYDQIYLPCRDEYKDIYTRLKDGSLRLEEVDRLFKAYKDKYEDLTQELDIMCKQETSANKQWIHNRVQQVQQYHELHLAVASAKVIMMVKDTLGLQGDFQVLETLTDVVSNFKREPLNRIDNDLMQAKMVLVDITEPRRLCLQELELRRHFVRWVKDALEDINELKVFVDLASISAGENDMDVDRVACFHDAVLGYSSVLYELKPDSGFRAFKDVLNKLWRALENDNNLPKKLRDSARHLEWLKTVKDSHGSVELSSLSLASAINNKGIYLISARDVKKLQIPEEHDEGRQMRCYSLEDLRELQNKLMLMSGKGDQGQNEVERFVEVFASVQRLTEAFIALYTAGNPLFRHWEVQINCSSSCDEPSILMDFNLVRALSVIVEGSPEEQLPELCRKMEKCLEYWMNFVHKQRSQQYFLNYYTAEQIVYLCGKLTQQNVNKVEDQVLMMLSFIKPNCTSTDLRHVWHDELDPLQSLVEKAKGLQAFDHIWNAYMKDMKNFLPDILDIRTLGLLGKFINRQLPRGLVNGKPNLIVCPHDDALASCISIYMSSKDEALPTYDEVLLCNPSTPYEEVELFLRRCLGNGYRGQKIYSLVYGDLLSYDVSSKVENFFQQMKMQSRKDYRLVIICSSEREHAYLPSAFSQYRLHMIPQEPLARIQQYLQQHYTVPVDQCSAAAAFKDRLCVGVVSSQRAGVGKSLYIRRMYEKLKHSTKKQSMLKCICLIEPKVDETVILQSLLDTPKRKELIIFHFDVTSSVQKGLPEFLFKLLILRYLMDSEGKMWRCNDKQMYVIEILEPTVKSTGNAPMARNTFLDMFPKIFCRPPKEVLMLEMRKQENPTIVSSEDPLMDDKEFRSEAFQRPYQYLTRFHNKIDLDVFTYQGVEGSHVECLQMLLMYCGVMDPSWAELRNFTWFLNLQLRDCETSVFCDATFTGDTLTGFKTFVVDFMILMAKDFATPSLSISDQSPGRSQVNLVGVRDEDLAPFLIRKRWETEPHPYIFFNDDHVSMTFIGFHLQPNDQNFVDAIEPTSGRVIRRNVMTKALYEGLQLQRVPFNIDFDTLPRWEKIERICNVLGIQWPLDPDETYELTTDNILKMLAIHMRFRCGIPVIIMGETGCGKTRLIKFLCELRRSGVAAENMKLVKVHGGTTSEMIYGKVREAEDIASINKQDYGFDSVLFFDEANTTEAISSIKEVLCDKTVKGESLTPNSGLQIIAACNPYRKHTDDMIQRLESAGLGYRVRAEETDEKLGSIPLRQLVYRVQALPPSMIPLVWDFGQLNDHTEKIYIQQIVQRVTTSKSIDQTYIKCITDVLSASQKYMRTRKDECSFVSLRDVERCMQAFCTQNDEENEPEVQDPVLWSLVMAIGVCYHACLENKDKYRQKISTKLPSSYNSMRVMHEISLMQDLLLSGVPMGDTIARNSALKENVFMMVLCIELRIPLFLVGKPGSSKSLSKTLVADAMQGQAAHSELYKMLKQIHLVSFQCSPHSTPEGIINTFKQCGRFQEGKNLNEYISVVVLDEIGLAEDSPKMPLKTLHPLLEEGCIDDEPLPHKKVGFIGISNWALDPAKMNRGIFVSRGDPDEKELIESAKGICSSDVMVLERVRDFFQPFARSYLNICRKQGKGFFGLRDYYSLVKMIFAVAKTSQRKPAAEEIVKVVLRNFSGRDDVDVVSVFTQRLKMSPNLENINTIEFVKENIQAVGQDEECRYLLVLTKNYAALQILQQTFFSESGQPEIIFGSSFPKDQEYTQICRNINRVKICMETGQTVVLLNLQNLYESLYDALNQYYVCLGGQKYVDLGLGTHRVKCRVHKDFRLIVIEEREVVYKQFPIPLINRLEKHYLDIHTVLKAEQKKMVEELERWAKLFVSLTGQHAGAADMYKYTLPDVFIGYHSDTCASVILQVIEEPKDNSETSDSQRGLLDQAKLILLKCATPDSVVRLDCTGLPKVESQHMAKVTTFSRLLTAFDMEPLEKMFYSVELLSLQQFDTEHSFLKKIRNFLTAENGGSVTGPCNRILIIQCDFDEPCKSSNLIASAKYSSLNEINKVTQESKGCRVFVYFITRLPRMEGGTSYIGFHGGPWRSVHIDDLRRSKDIVSDIKTLQNMKISQMFETKTSRPEGKRKMLNIDLDNVVDTTSLLRSCVQTAVGMLRDQVTSGFRSTRRVEILLTLLSDTDELRDEFLQTVKKRLHSLLLIHDGNTFMKSNWVLKEASNIDALQEGGTFRHTLWKRVQAVVVPILAHLVSVIDRDQNMDLLLDKNCSEAVKRLWLDIFGDEKLVEISHLAMDSRSTRTILVQNYIPQDRNIGCIMPFSWRIKDYLEELCVHVLQNEGHNQLKLIEIFWNTPLGRYIEKADSETQMEFYHRYLQDFISMSMNVTSSEDLKVVLILLNAIKCHIVREKMTALPWVHAAYHKFKNRLQNLSRMMCTEPQVTKDLLGNPHAGDSVELVLDVYAAFACLEHLEPRVLATDAQRQAWLRQVKKLQVPIELICSEDSVRHYGERRIQLLLVFACRSGWNRIFSLSLFVEHMLMEIEQLDTKLTPLVLEHMRGLGKVSTCFLIFVFRDEPVSMKLTLVRVGQHAQFRKRCNAFFIDLVSTVCFKDNSPPSSAVIFHLLNFLMFLFLSNGFSCFCTSVLRSRYRWRLLYVATSLNIDTFFFSFDEVKEYLQQHLVAVEQSNMLDETDKTELYCMYINCLEDSMFERLQFRSAADQKAYFQNESAFLTECLQTHGQHPEKPSVEYLQQLARVRMDLDRTASLIVENMRETAFLDSVVNLCRRSGNDWYRVYLIRKICSQYGVEFVQKRLRRGQMSWLFPEEVQLQVQLDHYLVCGNDYKTIREAVAKTVMEGKVEGLDEACEVICAPQLKAVYLLLALYREITTLYGHANEALSAYIQASKVLASPEVKAFAQALVTNKMGPLSARPGTSGAQSVAVELTVHLAAVLLCGNQGIIAPLQQLALTPVNMQVSFLPSMPEDIVAAAQQALGPLQWYRNLCVDCGAVIGGNNHAPVQGFQVLAMQGDRTQTGHILGDPSRRDNPDMLDTKNMSPVPFNVVRMLTHMAMLLGACNHTQVTNPFYFPQVPDPAAFLLNHLRKDVEHLIKSLGKGTDDTITTVHLVITISSGPVPYDNRLSNKEARNGWELEMSNAVIAPQLKHLDRHLKEVNAFIRADSRISANPIMKLVYGDPRLFLASLPANSLLHCSAVWSCREKVCVLSLTHILEQNDGKDTVPVLWRFLHKEAELRLVKYLPDILTLQKNLVKKFQNITELTYETINEFLHSQKAAWYEKYIKIFLTTWNQLRVSLATNGEIKIPNEFCQKDLDLNSDLKVLLPQRQGAGLCSTALISYLIALHNDLIYCVDKHTGEETSYKVSPADLTDLHVIRYELERDLMPLILSNTQYSIEKGQETLHEYDLFKIQQQIISRFLLGKPRITLDGIPTLVNRHDRDYQIILRDVKSKVAQTLTLFSVAGELHSYSEVCEALSTLEVALGFLAMTGGEPHMQLSRYLEEVLQMGNQRVRLHFPLSFPEKYKKPLGEEEHRLLTAFFSRNSADTFLLEMHEFLVLVLKKSNDPDTYSLKESLVSYMEQKDMDIPPDVEEHFPEEVFLSHYVEAWKFIIAFKQERGQRQ